MAPRIPTLILGAEEDDMSGRGEYARGRRIEVSFEEKDRRGVGWGREERGLDFSPVPPDESGRWRDDARRPFPPRLSLNLRQRSDPRACLHSLFASDFRSF